MVISAPPNVGNWGCLRLEWGVVTADTGLPGDFLGTSWKFSHRLRRLDKVRRMKLENTKHTGIAPPSIITGRRILPPPPVNHRMPTPAVCRHHSSRCPPPPPPPPHKNPRTYPFSPKTSLSDVGSDMDLEEVSSGTLTSACGRHSRRQCLSSPAASSCPQTLNNYR